MSLFSGFCFKSFLLHSTLLQHYIIATIYHNCTFKVFMKVAIAHECKEGNIYFSFFSLIEAIMFQIPCKKATSPLMSGKLKE